ncbi:hypothetical protein HPB51_022169 [Rhipicephalus microplus]|uniref:Uncharacterized protein n=1 Tax=Rhipicephalus microplus TaxID=6941 RepID=A0A9J6E4U3_RHIMP|nr:hypothetical protein HPB51_022169 [Rhipicephalus microplus]
MMKAFRAAAWRLAHSTEERERLISSFGEMVCAPTPEKFEDAQTDFLRHADAEACAYFQKNWADITNIVNIQAASSCSNPRTPQLKLPLVKPRGRPKCKSVQKGKRQREQQSNVATTLFVQMTEMAKYKLLLTGIVGKATSSRVLNCGYIIQEADVEVRPELLPSGLLDYRVEMRQLQQYFSEDAWQLLTSAGPVLQ